MPNIPPVVGLALLLSLGACDRFAAEQTKFTPQDMQAARRAIPPSDVSLMLRSGYSQAEIINQIQQRHLTEKPDAQFEQSVRRYGAGPALIQALKNEANVLTPAQQAAYQKILAEREEKAQTTRLVEQNRVQSDAFDQEIERQRKQKLAEETLQNAQNMEERVTRYDKAQREYISKKSQLEYHIAFEQACINQARGRGASDESLSGRLQALERYQHELAQLREPER